MNRLFLAIFLTVLLFLSGCVPAYTEAEQDALRGVKSPVQQINSFQECANAGYPILRSMPPKCGTPDGRMFVDNSQAPVSPPPVASNNNQNNTACKDQCGDGSCQQMVCQAVGCPCAETPKNCPSDCGSPFLR